MAITKEGPPKALHHPNNVGAPSFVERLNAFNPESIRLPPNNGIIGIASDGCKSRRAIPPHIISTGPDKNETRYVIGQLTQVGLILSALLVPSRRHVEGKGVTYYTCPTRRKTH